MRADNRDMSQTPLSPTAADALRTVIKSRGARIDGRTAATLRRRGLVESPHWNSPNFVKATPEGVRYYLRHIKG